MKKLSKFKSWISSFFISKEERLAIEQHLKTFSDCFIDEYMKKYPYQRKSEMYCSILAEMAFKCCQDFKKIENPAKYIEVMPIDDIHKIYVRHEQQQVYWMLKRGAAHHLKFYSDFCPATRISLKYVSSILIKKYKQIPVKEDLLTFVDGFNSLRAFDMFEKTSGAYQKHILLKDFQNKTIIAPAKKSNLL